jgi:hypothetical protein
MAADGVAGVEIARRLSLSIPQVSRIRRRFERGRVEGLADQPKPGRGNNVPEALVRRVVAAVMSPPPPGHSHWSTRELGRRVGLGHTAVHKILRANDLKPHRQRTFKVSKDPRFSERVQDVVGLYLNPPQNAVVVSMDEKTQVQALDRTQPMLPLRPGQIERRTHDYRRNGVVDLYAALEIATGRVLGDCKDSHTGEDFLSFLKRLERTFRKGELHVVLDNSSTHKTPEVHEWLAAHPRVVFHFTPTSARPGSTRSRASSASLPAALSGVPAFPRRPPCADTLRPSSGPGTRTQLLSFGPSQHIALSVTIGICLLESRGRSTSVSMASIWS